MLSAQEVHTLPANVLLVTIANATSQLRQTINLFSFKREKVLTEASCRAIMKSGVAIRSATWLNRTGLADWTSRLDYWTHLFSYKCNVFRFYVTDNSNVRAKIKLYHHCFLCAPMCRAAPMDYTDKL